MHTNPEVLALLALGEQTAASPNDRDHIAGCEACRAEVEELAHLAGVGRSVDEHVRIESPSPQVWERIQAELGLSSAQAPVTTAKSSQTQDHDVNAETTTRPSRRRRVLSLALAAALALLAGIGAGIVWERFREPSDAVIAQTDLTALPDWTGATGEATLERDATGNQVLVVTMATPRPVDGIQEVWLINTTVTGMQSVGLLTQPRQRFRLPAGLDVTKFPIVDVSDEPVNGVSAHSGNSIVRGTLDV